MKKIIKFLALALVVLVYLYINDRSQFYSLFEEIKLGNSSIITNGEDSHNDELINSLYDNERSGVQVEGAGVVLRLLPTDNDGSRHQKFIVKLASGQTLMISHNIDLAPVIDTLSKNDDVAFYGEYEWNSSGGLVHWTHNDPNGRHEDGWILHNEKIYQ